MSSVVRWNPATEMCWRQGFTLINGIKALKLMILNSLWCLFKLEWPPNVSGIQACEDEPVKDKWTKVTEQRSFTDEYTDYMKLNAITQSNKWRDKWWTDEQWVFAGVTQFIHNYVDCGGSWVMSLLCHSGQWVGRGGDLGFALGTFRARNPPSSSGFGGDHVIPASGYGDGLATVLPEASPTPGSRGPLSVHVRVNVQKASSGAVSGLEVGRWYLSGSETPRLGLVFGRWSHWRNWKKKTQDEKQFFPSQNKIE